jgi:SAM-dependent methyltransferase
MMEHAAGAERERIVEAYRRRENTGRGRRGFFTFEDLAQWHRVQERHRETLRMLKRYGFDALGSLRILDVGCGDGNMLRQFVQWGAEPANLAGIDLRPDAVEQARRLAPHLDARVGCATSLPWPDASFDLVSQHTVFTSILDGGVRIRVAAEMARVLRPGGAVVWYDFLVDNPYNPDVRGVRRGEIERLFPSLDAHFRRLTLLPPLARRMPAVALPLVYPLLAACPLLCTHILGLLISSR